MQISAIGVTHLSAYPQKRLNRNVTSPTADYLKNSPMVISFKGGNKEHVLHVAGEAKPYFQKGGVATVINDYLTLNNASSTEVGKAVVVTPYYNGLIKYAAPDEKADDLFKVSVELPRVPEGLPEGHPFKDKVGQPIYTKKDLSLNKLKDVLINNKDDCWLLEEVASKDMEWGMQENAPTKLLKVVENAGKGPVKHDLFMVFTEATAFYPEPYADNQYSSAVKEIVNSWGGDPYAKYDKAVVEYMEDISKKVGNFDPGTVVCSDSQAAYVTHYMAKKNAEGIEYFQGKKPMQIGHNLGDGYIGITSARNMIVNLGILNPQELRAMADSDAFKEAIAKGGKAEADYYEKFLANMKAKNKLSALSVATHYGNTGYLPTWGVVSQGYVDEIVKNKEIAPFLFEDIKDLHAKGILVGRTNPLNIKDQNAFSKTGMESFDKPHKIKLRNGKEEIIEPLKFFTEADRATLTLEQLREQKRVNKINFLKRFSQDYVGAQLFNEKENKWGIAGSGTAKIRGKNMPILSNVNIDKYIAKLEKGEDVKFVTCWGRGDFQKAFDETIEGFKRYVYNTGDDNVVLLMGGDLSVDKAEGQIFKDKVELFKKDEKLADKMLCMDDFVPGRAMAQVSDCVVVASRTAPCELVDLEAKQHLCTPITANGQGLGQKNFDPGIPEEAKLADAFKTKHQFFNSREELLKDAKRDATIAFEKVYNKLKNNIETKYKVAFGADTVPQDLLKRYIKDNPEYKDALRRLRDEVMADDIANALERCLIKHRNDDVARTILKNQVNGKYGWEDNQVITRSPLPSGELYRSDFRKDGTEVKSRDIIGNGVKLPNGTKKRTRRKKGYWTQFRRWTKTKTGKWAVRGAAAAVVLSGFGYVAHKLGWLSPEFASEKKPGDLSRVV